MNFEKIFLWEVTDSLEIKEDKNIGTLDFEPQINSLLYYKFEDYRVVNLKYVVKFGQNYLNVYVKKYKFK